MFESGGDWCLGEDGRACVGTPRIVRVVWIIDRPNRAGNDKVTENETHIATPRRAEERDRRWGHVCVSSARSWWWSSWSRGICGKTRLSREDLAAVRRRGGAVMVASGRCAGAGARVRYFQRLRVVQSERGLYPRAESETYGEWLEEIARVDPREASTDTRGDSREETQDVEACAADEALLLNERGVTPRQQHLPASRRGSRVGMCHVDFKRWTRRTKTIERVLY